MVDFNYTTARYCVIAKQHTEREAYDWCKKHLGVRRNNGGANWEFQYRREDGGLVFLFFDAPEEKIIEFKLRFG